jgi:hypothetical protein
MEQPEHGPFDLETLKLLREVLDEAWERLSPIQRARIQKSDIALHILRHALGGERDPAKLWSAAVTEVIVADNATLCHSEVKGRSKRPVRNRFGVEAESQPPRDY